MWDNPVHICPVLGSCCGADRSHNRQRTALWRVKQKQFNLSTEASVCKSASLIHLFFFFKIFVVNLAVAYFPSEANFSANHHSTYA